MVTRLHTLAPLQPPPSATVCPLCGQPNQCAMAADQRADTATASAAQCWCNHLELPFPPDLLARLAADQRGTACICQTCVQRHQRAVPTSPVP